MQGSAILAKGMLLLAKTMFESRYIFVDCIFAKTVLLLNFGVGNISGVAIVDFLNNIFICITTLLNIRGYLGSQR